MKARVLNLKDGPRLVFELEIGLILTLPLCAGWFKCAGITDNKGFHGASTETKESGQSLPSEGTHHLTQRKEIVDNPPL